MRHLTFSTAAITVALLLALSACATDTRSDRNGGHAGTSAETSDGSVGDGADGGLVGAQHADECDPSQPDIEGCPCEEGDTHACYDGPIEARGLGACSDGVQKCVLSPVGEFYHYGACKGAKLPASEEACDGKDRDCDGAIDDGCPCDADAEPRACDIPVQVGRRAARRRRTRGMSSWIWSSAESGAGHPTPSRLAACHPSPHAERGTAGGLAA